MTQDILLYPPELATQFISEFEQGPKGGPALESYRCPAGVWTIGFGHAQNVHKGDVITRSEAYELLDRDLERTQEELATLIHIDINENQFIALMSFVYNFGLTKCRTYRLFGMINRGEWENVRTWWPKYCNPDNPVVTKGLRDRRMRELELFFRS